MKLELKHLVPYLPYGLEIEIHNYKIDYVGIKHSIVTGYYYLNFNPHFTYEGGSTGKSFNEFKPILRPLSDLTFEELREFNFVALPEINYDVENYSYGFMQFCFKNHFDVFGLIEKGIAIDINTLEK